MAGNLLQQIEFHATAKMKVSSEASSLFQMKRCSIEKKVIYVVRPPSSADFCPRN